LFFSNLSTGTGLTFSWNFADPVSGKSNYSTAASPIHIYDSAGSYSVILTATNSGGCSNTITQKANVEANPTVGPWRYKINNQTVTFTPQDTTQKTYEWHFGTGDSSSTRKPVYTYQSKGKYDVKLVETNTAGCSGSYSDTIALTGLGVEPVSGLANDLNISIFPNPFESKMVISYTLTDDSKVDVSVYDIQGKLIATLKDGNLVAGKYQDEYDAAKYNASEGVYLLKMTVNGEVFTGRIVEIKQ
jgi:PKD repeat protein